MRVLVRSRGLGDVYKRPAARTLRARCRDAAAHRAPGASTAGGQPPRLRRDAARRVPSLAGRKAVACLLYTSDAADQRASVDLGGRRIINKK
mgnify:CR=1 FL=1